MSKFLAPIHFWLYHKIEIQEEFIKEILEESKVSIEDFYGENGSLPKGSLEDNIDTDNIHAWLQDRMIESERRLAKAVALAKEKGLTEEELKQIFYKESSKGEKVSSPEEVYQKVQDICLDGMPCDRVNLLVENSSNKVEWERTRDLHGSFFEDEGIRKEFYYDLRDAYIQGMIGEFEYIREGRRYIVRRKDV